MIVLNRLQANVVRGLTSKGNALAPAPTTTRGQFVLPELVLNDPAHAKFRTFLDGLPKVSDDSITIDPDPVRRRRFDFSLDWRPGEVITIDDTP